MAVEGDLNVTEVVIHPVLTDDTTNNDNLTITGVRVVIKDKDNNVVLDQIVGVNVDETTNNDSDVTVDFDDKYLTELSGDYKYEIYFMGAGGQDTGDKVKTTKVDFDTADDTDPVSDYSIIWSDKAADNVTLSTDDWFTEANIPGVPASLQTVRK